MIRIDFLLIFYISILLNFSYAQNEFLLNQYDIKSYSINASFILNPVNQLQSKYNSQSITITHSSSQTVILGNSIACATLDSGLHTDNSYWRAFDLDSFGISQNFNVTNVSIGVELAISDSGFQQIVCNLYSSSVSFPDNFPNYLTLVGSSTVYIANQTATIIDIPVSGRVPAGSELVVQIFTPDGRPSGNSFFIGSNNSGQTGPSYFSAIICEISSPTNLADLGFPNMHIVMNVVGYEGDLRARVQIVHNSADVIADSVDVYINDMLTLDDFTFRSATPFLDLIAGINLNIGIARSNSVSVNDTIINFPIIFTEGEKYIAFINGISHSGYAPNPDGRDIVLKLFVQTLARETSLGSDVDLFVFHGSTDAPTVDIKAREDGNFLLVDDAAYGDITSYFSVSPADYILDLYLNDGITLVNSFISPLSSFGGKALSLFGSGFLNSSLNQNGPSLGLFAALADGTVVEFESTNVISVESTSFTVPDELALYQNYPNPFNSSTTISFSLPINNFVTLKIFNIVGQEISTLINEVRDAGSYSISFDASSLPSGIYFCELMAGDQINNNKMVLIK